MSTLPGIEKADITGVHTLILVVKDPSDHIEVCWVSVHWHQDHSCVVPNGQKREIRWHYSRKETSTQGEIAVYFIDGIEINMKRNFGLILPALNCPSSTWV